METTFIYALTEPGTKIVRYFGKANDPHERCFEHIRYAKQGKKWYTSRWIRKLFELGKRPDVHILCEVPRNDWARFEIAFITLGRQCGFDLTNGTDGGDCGPLTKGKPLSPEHRAKVSAALKGREISLECRAKLRAARVGKPLSQEHREKLRLAKLGRKFPLETRLKMSEARLGEKNYWFGKKLSPEHRAKMSAAKKGKRRGNSAS